MVSKYHSPIKKKTRLLGEVVDPRAGGRKIIVSESRKVFKIKRMEHVKGTQEPTCQELPMATARTI